MRKLSFARSLVRILGGGTVIAGGVSCASPGIPPGGPEDTAAPKITRIAPDSGRTRVTPREVIFRFDEVVSERPSGAPSLAALFLISPVDGSPNVGWHREEVSIRPRRGWRPNTVYTITMLPGMTDLRGNVRNTGAVTIFSTGVDIPTSHVSGTVFNWLTGNLAPRAFIEARTARDTGTVYVTAADSAGTFTFPNLAAGQYRVRAILDDNNNRGLDPRESWDTVSVALADSAKVELYAFPHDSVGARLMSVGLKDSVTLELLFDHAIDPGEVVTPAMVSIRTSDSATVPVLNVARPELPIDTTARERVRPSRPTPSTSLLVKVGVPILQRTVLRVRTADIRGLDRVAVTSERIVTLAPPPPPAGVRPTPPLPPPAPPPPPAAAPIKR